MDLQSTFEIGCWDALGLSPSPQNTFLGGGLVKKVWGSLTASGPLPAGVWLLSWIELGS